MEGATLLAICFVFTMFAGVFLIFLALRQRSETLERQHRERMAMIERGHIPLTPPQERPARGGTSRSLSLGIIIVGVGFALMMIIGIAGETPSVGIGIGGAIVILGGAFIVRSVLVRPDAPPHSTPPGPPTPTL
jgi:hypothetical protein